MFPAKPYNSRLSASAPLSHNSQQNNFLRSAPKRQSIFCACVSVAGSCFARPAVLTALAANTWPARFTSAAPARAGARKLPDFFHSFQIISLCLFLSTALVSCDPDSSGAKTYTTTISGKIITPGRAADPSKGSTIGTAKVWASPDNKISVEANGSYSLKVTHSGTFTLTADYTGADGNYKMSAPQTVKTSQANYTRNIALKYGHTTTLTGDIMGRLGGAVTTLNGATVVIEVEGMEVARDISKSDGNYKVIFNHPGRLTIRVNPPAGVSLRSSVLAPATTDKHINQAFVLL